MSWVSLAVALVVSASSSETVSSVVLPLADYERLRDVDGRSSATGFASVESVQVEGSLQSHRLTLVFQGRAWGKHVSVPVLSAGSLRVSHCEGEALLRRTEEGRLDLTPLSDRFVLRCRLAADGASMKLSALGGVLDLESRVQDAKASYESEGQGIRTLTLVARNGDDTATVEPQWIGARYHLSVEPQETKFHYDLVARNLTPNAQILRLRFASGEQLDRSKSPSAAEKNDTWTVQALPGETIVTFTGTLKGSQFTPPIELPVQYLLVENAPALRVDTSTSARRISTAETGIPSTNAGAAGFAIEGRTRVRWTATELQTLPSTRYAVNTALHTFFLGDNGRALGETTLSLENRGAPALSIPMSGRPLFASIGGQSCALTHDADGNLWLPLGTGKQDVVVQQQQFFWRRWGLGAARLELPRLGEPATQGTVQVLYGSGWVPLFERFQGDWRSGLPGLGGLLSFLAWWGWTQRVCAFLGVSARRRQVLAMLASLAAVASSPANTGLLIVDSIGTALWLLPRLGRLHLGGLSAQLRRMKGTWVVVLVGVCLMLSVTWFGDSIRRAFGNSADSLSGSMAMSYPGLARFAEGSAGDEKAADVYRGVGVSTQLPVATRSTVFQREMLASDRPVSVEVLLLSTWLVHGLEGALLLATVSLFLLNRRALLDGTLRGLRTWVPA